MSTEAGPNGHSGNGMAWLAAAWPALLLSLLTGLWILAVRPLLPVDETRYLSVAWEMWLRGDFRVPYKNGVIYTDKPPLLLWLMHAGWAVLGVNEWWPRLLPTLAAMTSLLLTARLACALWPQQPAVARLAPWLLATAVLWQAFTGAVMFDTLLTVFSLLCLNALVAPPFGRGRWLWFGLGIGGGLLTKGPVILLHTLPAALLAPWWYSKPAEQQGQHPWRRWYGGLLASMLGGVVIGLAWFVPALREADAGYGAAVGIHQTTDRLLHGAHHRPWWWYLPLLPALPLPWTLWPPLYRGLALLRRHGGDAGVRFCVAATVPALVVFCFISGKQAHYLLPLLAPAAALAARALLAVEGPTTRATGWPLALLLAGAGLAVLAMPLHQPAPGWTRQIPMYVPAGLLLAAAVIGWPRRPERLAAVYRTGLAFALAFGAFYAGAMQALAPGYRLAELAGRIAAAQASGAPVAHVGKYHAQFQFVGRLRQPLDVLHDPVLPAWAAAHPDGYVVYPCDDWRPAPPGVYGQPYRGGALRLWPVALLTADLSEKKLCGD